MPVPRLDDILDAIAAGRHPTPFDVLGWHPGPAGSGGRGEGAGVGGVVRVFRPDAASVTVVREEDRTPMRAAGRAGIFVAEFPDSQGPFSYRLEVVEPGGAARLEEDPYRFGPFLGEDEIRRLARGEDLALHERLGAHVARHEGVDGVRFAVWAPHGRRVSVIGDFNRWDARRHPMRPRGATGVWELFVPGLAPGALYKYDILTDLAGRSAVKADPCGRAMQLRPDTASVVTAPEAHRWRDADWMAERARRQAPDRPVSIYEVHLGSWKRSDGKWPGYRELAETLVPYAVEMGFTHLELLPVTEHPYDGSWGYQTVGYFAPTARHGSPDDLRAFVDAAHRAGLGVILDWVPAHFPRDGHGLGFFDGTHLYEHADPRRGLHRDWGTFIFDFGRPPVAAFLLASASFWLESFHVDGLRVDAVASMLYLDYSRDEGDWIPNERGGRENLEAVEFLRRLNAVVHEEFPGVLTFAEESTSWPGVTAPAEDGGLGFDYKWNMGWMNDTLSYHSLDPLARGGHQNLVTFPLTYAFSERFLLPLSHDEVVHGKASLLAKMPGDRDQKFANLRALYGWMTAHPGKKLLFMGSEIGPWTEWSHERELEWGLLEHEPHRTLRAWVRALNQLYAKEPALHEVDVGWNGFEWIDCTDRDRSVVSCVRRAEDPADFLVVIANFTPVTWKDYRVEAPAAREYEVVLNADSREWGGTGVDVPARLPVDGGAIALDLPPMAVLFLRPIAGK